MFSIMLMYGSVKGSRWLILPWLVATFLFILAYIAGMILSTILFGVTLLSIAFLAIAIIEVSSEDKYFFLHFGDRWDSKKPGNFISLPLSII